MFKIGKTQKLYINRFSEPGAYLSDEINGENEVLLPNKFVKDQMDIDDEVSVFVYKDSEGRLVATTQTALIEIQEIKKLKVVSDFRGGYFLDMGLDKDLLLPFGEAKDNLRKGKKVLVQMLLDEDEKLYATMKVYNHLTEATHYKTGDMVDGTVIEVKEPFGAFIAVDNQYHGLIPQNEMYAEIVEGATIKARVTRVKADGKLNLSIREKAHVQIDKDTEILLEALKQSEGILYLNDDTDPEIIKKRLNLSKRAFKRAVGRLYKEGLIELTSEGIKLTEQSSKE